MGLGTSYPASTGTKPPSGTGDRVPPGTPPQTGSRQYSQTYPQNNPDWYTPGQTTPSTLGPMSPFNQAISDFNTINTNQGDALLNQYLNKVGFANLGYDNEEWYRNAKAQNDLAALGLAEGRDIGLGRDRNNADRGFAGRGFDIDSRGNALKRDMGYRANTSEAAGRGSITSFGYGQNNRDILSQFGIAQDGTQLAYDKKMSDLAFSDKAIDSLAADYGLKRADINNALKYTMTQLGLDQSQTMMQLEEMLSSGNDQLAMNAINFMNQMMSMPMDQITTSDLGLAPRQMPGQPLELGPASLAYLEQQRLNGAGGSGGAGGSSGGGGPQFARKM